MPIARPCNSSFFLMCGTQTMESEAIRSVVTALFLSNRAPFETSCGLRARCKVLNEHGSTIYKRMKSMPLVDQIDTSCWVFEMPMDSM
jgi:hypothetical protein